MSRSSGRSRADGPGPLAWLRAVAPALAGLVAGTAWWLAGERRTISLTGLLAWTPAIAGLLVAAVAAAVVGARCLRRHRERAVRRAAARGEHERHRRFVARLDHEMKNPIQGIRSALADAPGERQRASIDVQARRLARLLHDLRRLGEAEGVELDLGAVDPSVLVAEAVEAARELPGADERRWSVSLPRAPRPLPVIEGDGDLLYLALTNVLTTAVKYSRPDDAIEVRARETGGGVAIEIADTGIGVPPDELDLVWEELGRGQEARGIEGAGLGLPFVRAIVDRHGGDATLRSRHGEGTSVTITLPLEPPGGDTQHP